MLLSTVNCPNFLFLIKDKKILDKKPEMMYICGMNLRLMKLSLAIVIILLQFFTTAFLAYSNSQWQISNSGINGVEINFVAVNPKNNSVIYAALDNAIYKTTNSGKLWKWLFSVSGTNNKINYILIPPDKENEVYIVSENGLYRSTNQGKNWQLLYQGKSQESQNCLCVVSFDKTILIGTEKGIFKSFDSGRTWNKENGALGNLKITAISLNPINNNIIFAAAQDGLYQSQDQSKNWKKVYSISNSGTSDEEDDDNNESEDSEAEESNNDQINHIVIDPKNTNNIYIAMDFGILHSKDNAKSWVKFINHGLLTEVIRFLAIEPQTSLIYAATDSGVFIYQEKKWEQIHNGIYTNNIQNISLDAKGNLWAATDQGVFCSKADELTTEKQTAKSAVIKNDSEPTIAEIQKAVINYADIIRPERLEAHRKGITMSALMPSVDFDLDVEEDHWETGSTSAGAKGDDYLWPDVDAKDWSFGLSWNFADLIWNDQQRLLDSQQKSMIELRDDLLDKVTRYYFERKRLQEELAMSISEEDISLREKQLRIEELAAYIDALTGGYLSKCNR